MIFHCLFIISFKKSKHAIIFSSLELQRSEIPLQFALIVKFSRGRPKMGAYSNAVIGMIDQRHILIKMFDVTDFYKAWTKNSHEMEGAVFRLFK